MNYRILVINPGSTSTKMGVFDGENCVFQETLRHSADELAPFSHVMEQVDFRRALVEKVQSGEILYCPHGRPVKYQLSKYDIEKMFKRA